MSERYRLGLVGFTPGKSTGIRRRRTRSTWPPTPNSPNWRRSRARIGNYTLTPPTHTKPSKALRAATWSTNLDFLRCVA